MAILNIRIEDRFHDQLKAMADDEGVTLSEFVRNLLMEAMIPVSDREETRHGDEPAQESLRTIDRQTLSMLHRILGYVLPKDANGTEGDLQDQIKRAEILEDGFTGEYWLETAGFRTELSIRDCRRVADILDMFRNITSSIERLESGGQVVDEEKKYALEFEGFDHNNPLEAHMADYVRFLMRNDRWTDLKPQLDRNDNGNSHHPTLDTYMRLLAEYRRIMGGRDRGIRLNGYFLSLEELEKIAEASIHPANRKAKP